jgi:hypothetical protein
MSSTSFFIIAALLTAVAATTDPIDRLVADLSADPMWMNGISPIIDLPQDASTKEVVAEVLKMTGFPSYPRRPWTYKILKIRQVHIKGPLPDLYTAVLLDTNHGRQIVLLRYLEHSWWSRVIGAG